MLFLNFENLATTNDKQGDVDSTAAAAADGERSIVNTSPFGDSEMESNFLTPMSSFSSPSAGNTGVRNYRSSSMIVDDDETILPRIDEETIVPADKDISPSSSSTTVSSASSSEIRAKKLLFGNQGSSSDDNVNRSTGSISTKWASISSISEEEAQQRNDDDGDDDIEAGKIFTVSETTIEVSSSFEIVDESMTPPHTPPTEDAITAAPAVTPLFTIE